MALLLAPFLAAFLTADLEVFRAALVPLPPATFFSGAALSTALPATAPIARERLQILLAHERGMRGEQPELLMLLREEILAAVSRHVALDPDKVIVRMERGKNVSTLEVDVELPNGLERSFAVAS